MSETSVAEASRLSGAIVSALAVGEVHSADLSFDRSGGLAPGDVEWLRRSYATMLRPGLKRAIDLVITLALLIASAPVWVVIAVAISLDGGPIFFGHRRITRGGRTFGCLKFRTMVPNAGARLQDLLRRDPAARAEWETSQKLRSDPRITRVGRLLRAWSLDELPQLLNILWGDMSLVGPRPVVQQELDEHYGPAARAYLAVRPGLTGAWQVSGRSSTSFAYRVRLDEAYVSRPSLRTDCAIMLKTVRVVLLRDGAC
jgi:lipopolysaccharide/colanic/teichoic acid biosynthesis glycosyltransferase